MRALKQLYFSVYTFPAPILVTCENGQSHEIYIYILLACFTFSAV